MTEHQDRMSDAARMERVMAALSESGHEGRVREEWGGTFPDLMRFLAVATAPAGDGLVALRESIARGPKRTLVFAGEFGNTMSPLNDPVVQCMQEVLDLLVPVSYPMSLSLLETEDQEGRAPLRVVFGGCLDALVPANCSGSGFAWMYGRLTKWRHAKFACADDLSLQVDQRGMIWASFVHALRAERVVFLLPPAMIARVAAAVYGGLSDILGARSQHRALSRTLAQVNDVDARRAVSIVSDAEWRAAAAHEGDVSWLCSFPETICIPSGDWDFRGLGTRLTEKEQAFGPMRTSDVCATALIGGHVSRYLREQDPVVTCKAVSTSLSPVLMLNILTGSERG